jgi:hypothetical protein
MIDALKIAEYLEHDQPSTEQAEAITEVTSATLVTRADRKDVELRLTKSWLDKS